MVLDDQRLATGSESGELIKVGMFDCLRPSSHVAVQRSPNAMSGSAKMSSQPAVAASTAALHAAVPCRRRAFSGGPGSTASWASGPFAGLDFAMFITVILSVPRLRPEVGNYRGMFL